MGKNQVYGLEHSGQLPLEIALHVCVLSCFSRFSLGTVAHQAPLSMRFSRQEYWSGLACPPPGDHPDPEIKSMSLVSPPSAGGFFTTNTTCEASTVFALSHLICIPDLQSSYMFTVL